MLTQLAVIALLSVSLAGAKSYTKVGTAGRKFDRTAVLISKTDGANRLQSVTLAGSKVKVIFE